ncbi:recombinase family protein [Pseudomonas sp. CFBP 8770]|uniref:recombinase family protein n=1 Tax=unclassified Pseudomonas TaxID=196821 RepID=UPI001785F967|nr:MULTISPECIES: recombinase family protein [unclassified Pseudomonas]MBD8473091.1 recombinase family protein [Pseudomonas sp. CFBP 8773]MBD8645806.1 recombinase family protein [Pseudomonas sp. CFBP 8770]
MPTAFSYARFSSVTQKRGSSLERQAAMVANWHAQHPDYQRSELRYEDLGKSGWKGEHIKEGGGFAKLLAAVKAGAIKSGDAVLVESVDRAGRLDTLAMLDILGPILRKGVDIITLDDNVVYTRESLNGGHIYILLGKIQAARQYSDNLSRRLKGSYESRRKLAAVGTTPKRNTPVWLTSEGVVIPEIAAQVKTAFELYASGLGKTVIAKRMRDSGVPQIAKTAGPTVEAWLRNEAAIGRWNGSDVYEPIIDMSLFHRAQIEAAKRKTAPRSKTPTHFLVGLVKCGCCGHNFIMRTIRGVQVSMRCRKRQELQGCENIRVIPKEIIDAVYSYTSARAAREAIAQERTGVNETAIVAAEAKLLTLNKQAEDLAAAIREIGPVPEVLSQLRAASEERTETQGALAMLKSTVVPVAADGWLQRGKVWAMERNDSQRLAAMLRGVGYSMTVHLDKTITSTHSDTTYRFASVDRKSGSYRLYAGEELILIPKGVGDDERYSEPFTPDEPASSTWDDADYENLRSQYE